MAKTIQHKDLTGTIINDGDIVAACHAVGQYGSNQLMIGEVVKQTAKTVRVKFRHDLVHADHVSAMKKSWTEDKLVPPHKIIVLMEYVPEDEALPNYLDTKNIRRIVQDDATIDIPNKANPNTEYKYQKEILKKIADIEKINIKDSNPDKISDIFIDKYRSGLNGKK